MILIPVHAGRNALHYACVMGELEKVKWLIDVCALSPAIKDDDGTSPIHEAIYNGYHEIVEFLVEYDGSLISSIDERYGWYPLHTAALWDKPKCAQVLLKHGANVLQPAEEGKEIKSYKGLTPLHIAMEKRSPEFFDVLFRSVHQLKISPLQIFRMDHEYKPKPNLHVEALVKMFIKGKKLNT